MILELPQRLANASAWAPGVILPEMLIDAALEIEALRKLLAEAGALFRVYEQSHRAKGPGHEAKTERNAEIAGRIGTVLAASK